jgi:elongation factor G
MWPLIEIALETKTRQDQDDLWPALETLCAEDRTLRVHRDRDTGQLLLGGQSEDQLGRTLAALSRNGQPQIATGRPRVVYREAITRRAGFTYTHKKQLGGSGQYAEVRLVVEPLERGQGFVFVNRIFGGAVPRDLIPAVEQGLTSQKEDGVLAGYPTVDFRVTLADGKYDKVDSNAAAFEIAARACLREALRLAGPILLEPVMMVEVMTPASGLGDVIDDIGRRRGQIADQYEHDWAIAVAALVPLSEMIGYTEALRAMSQGRASFSMQYHRYDTMPRIDPPPVNFPPAVGMRA